MNNILRITSDQLVSSTIFHANTNHKITVLLTKCSRLRRIYQFVDRGDVEVSASKEKDLLRLLPRYCKGLSLYKEAKWRDAFATFSKASEFYPADFVCRVYLHRCNELMRLEAVPHPQWNGIYLDLPDVMKAHLLQNSDTVAKVTNTLGSVIKMVKLSKAAKGRIEKKAMMEAAEAAKRDSRLDQARRSTLMLKNIGSMRDFLSATKDSGRIGSDSDSGESYSSDDSDDIHHEHEEESDDEMDSEHDEFQFAKSTRSNRVPSASFDSIVTEESLSARQNRVTKSPATVVRQATRPAGKSPYSSRRRATNIR